MTRVETTPYLSEGARALRQAVFVEEQGFCEEFDEIDQTALHLTAYEDREAVACCRIYPERKGSLLVFHIGRVAVRRDRRGTGLGAFLMRQAEAAAKAQGGSVAVLSAQEQAAGFYEKLGYAQIGESYLDEHCPHVSMEKRLDRAQESEYYKE